MTMRHVNRLPWIIWLAAVLALLWLAFGGGWNQVQAHDPEPTVAVCQLTDELGDWTFPVGNVGDLLELCAEAGGTLGIIDNPGPDELIRQMWELGLYTPWLLMQDVFFQDEADGEDDDG